MIEEKVKDILKKYRNLEQKKDWKNQKLLGNDLKLHIPQELRIRSRGTERHSASN